MAYSPTSNQDLFIREGYYGGHTDVYEPRGNNVTIYDVNSLYPYIMATYDMPGGKPLCHGNLGNKKLEDLYGFFRAYIECPETIKKPFLPVKEKDGNTLLFPTGKFFGVYYSEELKYAEKLGYIVKPICGYTFDRMKTPFNEYMNSLYKMRLEAKKDNKDGESYIYKTLMNSLYGRFGINPNSSVTEIVDEIEARNLSIKYETSENEQLSDEYHLVTYSRLVNNDDPFMHWDPPKNSEVQLAAAITANARIKMYPYISRDDCIYTDTDSVFI
jgi:DNA polymerase elongation subunit (family B)